MGGSSHQSLLGCDCVSKYWNEKQSRWSTKLLTIMLTYTFKQVFMIFQYFSIKFCTNFELLICYIFLSCCRSYLSWEFFLLATLKLGVDLFSQSNSISPFRMQRLFLINEQFLKFWISLGVTRNITYLCRPHKMLTSR